MPVKRDKKRTPFVHLKRPALGFASRASSTTTDPCAGYSDLLKKVLHFFYGRGQDYVDKGGGGDWPLL